MMMMLMMMTTSMMLMMMITSMIMMTMTPQVSVYRDGSLRRHPVNSVLVRTTLENVSQASFSLKIFL